MDFSSPNELLKYLTSENVNYQELLSNAQNLVENIPVLHKNLEEKSFHAITQCILECIRRIYNFNSCTWISKSKLEYELKKGEEPIVFTRINGKGEICEYSIVNSEQVDFDKKTEYADEFEVISVPKKAKPKEKTEDVSDNTDYNKVVALLKSGENVFLTGFAGTGKSYILNKLKEKFKKNLTITSTTGIAAVNVKGQTLHSWAGVGLCKNPINKTVDKIKSRVSVLKQILNCKILAIDEISMLNIETFEYVDEVFKIIRNSTQPFGGIQVLFIGDFYQLPPVEVENNTERKYCFESRIWKDFNLKNIVLKRNYRQSEEKFIKALANMRVNNLAKEDLKLLESRETDINTFDTDMLHIFSTNDEANRYNLAKFNMIYEPVKLFYSIDGVYRGNKPVYDGFTENEKYILEIFGRNCRVENEVAFKLGAKVMLLINMDFNKGLINGSCGKITKFNEESIEIKFDNGVISSVPKHKFEYYYHDKIAAERTQYPLKLAYGITIHKSQGMTLDKLVVDCSRIFERGQAYVAMSRVKTIEGLYIKNFSKEKVMVDQKVSDFYSNLEELTDFDLKNQLEFLFDDDNTVQVSDEEAEKIIFECVENYSGQFGKSGICKILSGSKSIENNSFYTQICESKYFGALKSKKQKEITSLIQKLIDEKVFSFKFVSYGRPVLCVKK